ncbi:MAG: hypothetical protein ACI9J3_003582, partial [Parvicellaceae bacterium]
MFKLDDCLKPNIPSLPNTNILSLFVAAILPIFILPVTSIFPATVASPSTFRFCPLTNVKNNKKKKVSGSVLIIQTSIVEST